MRFPIYPIFDDKGNLNTECGGMRNAAAFQHECGLTGRIHRIIVRNAVECGGMRWNAECGRIPGNAAVFRLPRNAAVTCAQNV
jgi:hypothetical protein